MYPYRVKAFESLIHIQVSAKAHDSGDIAYEWKRSEHGNYGLGIDVAVKSAKQPEGADAPTPKGKK